MKSSWRFVDYKHIESNHFLQSAQWAQIRKALGWNVAAIQVTLATQSYTVLLLERSLVASPLARMLSSFHIPYSFIYSPYALNEMQSKVPLCNLDMLHAFNQCIYAACRERFPAAIFFRWDVPFTDGYSEHKLLHTAGFHLASSIVQAPDTVILDLNQSTEDLLATCKPKTRYNIRLAERKSVIIKQSNDVVSWYRLYQSTQQRQGMGIHAEQYYHAVMQGFKEQQGRAGDIRLYIAEHDGDLLAGIVVLHYGNQATYLYGASADIKRNYMASHLLQWHAICKAKESGMASYDFFGISPTADSSHQFYGLYRFKTGFGGTIIHRAGCWDIPLKKNCYALAHIAEGFIERKRNKKRANR